MLLSLVAKPVRLLIPIISLVDNGTTRVMFSPVVKGLESCSWYEYTGPVSESCTVKEGALNEEAITSSENDRVKILELRSKSKPSRVGLVPSMKNIAT